MVEIQNVGEIDLFVSAFDHMQRGRIRIGNRLGALERLGYDAGRLKELHQYLDEKMVTFEKEVDKYVCDFVTTHPLWTSWLTDVKGVGKHLAGLLLYVIQDASRFPTISKLWAYFGYIPCYWVAECEHGHKHMMSSDPVAKGRTCHVLISEDQHCCGKFITSQKIENEVPHRKEGYHFNFNSTGRTILWRIASCLIKANGIYKKMIYDKYKARDAALHPDFSPARLHIRATRKMIKLFLAHAWEIMRQAQRLPVLRPYTVVFQDEEYIPPLRDT